MPVAAANIQQDKVAMKDVANEEDKVLLILLRTAK